jgi:hypothetical protein
MFPSLPVKVWFLFEPCLESYCVIKFAAQHDESTQESETEDKLGIGDAFSARGYSSAFGLLASRFKQCLVYESHVRGIIEVWANEEAREVESRSNIQGVEYTLDICMLAGVRVAEEFEQGGKLRYTLLCLPLVQILKEKHGILFSELGERIRRLTNLGRPSAVPHVPCKRGKLHCQHHLRACNVHGLIAQLV